MTEEGTLKARFFATLRMADNYVQNDRGEGIPPRNYEAGTLKREIASVVSLLCNDRFPSNNKKFHKDRIRTN